ncbi:MAG TPA: endonuclease/exonuclease/phosphatase family protein [Conexibacter sp.]|nr:endonuclease/exonuclease/phosphatase family protein [Conexibacter sp.]
MRLRVLTWNVFHGRALPPRDEDLLHDFADRLAGWQWDVALLQEVPPWWPRELARACAAQHARALTSRNALLPLRRAVARCRPELLKANGGGCNAILVRGRAIAERRSERVRTWPERRVVHAVSARDEDGPIWLANVHASTGRGARTHADLARARTLALRWAGDAPLVLGGDFNVEQPSLPGFARASVAGRIDHVYARGLTPAAPPELLHRGTLSDHAPVRVTLAR